MRLTSTVLCHPSETTRPGYGIRLVQLRGVGDEQVDTGNVDLHVQIVVGDVQALVSILS